jgi:prophage regulatory protein
MPTKSVDRTSRYIGDGSAPYLRIAVVMDVTGLGRSTIYRMMAEHEFPSPVKLTKRVAVCRRGALVQEPARRDALTHGPRQALHRRNGFQ